MHNFSRPFKDHPVTSAIHNVFFIVLFYYFLTVETVSPQVSPLKNYPNCRGSPSKSWKQLYNTHTQKLRQLSPQTPGFTCLEIKVMVSALTFVAILFTI